jgi:phosphomannomutase
MVKNDAVVGGEESGGFGLRRHLPNKDGVAFAAITAAAEAREPFDDRVDRVLAEHGEVMQDRVSVDCPDNRKAAALEALEAEIPESVAGVAVDRVATIDGFKLLLADGSWLLVRPSGTEPKLRVYAEANSRERVDALLDHGGDLVSAVV